MFSKFLEDKEAWSMFITGPAGTGKTTSLAELVQYCMSNNINYVVCAYTHKACDILRSKLPPDAIVTTLHSKLKKRPTINDNATKMQHLESSRQHGRPDIPAIMFLDEFSMVGELDYMDIVAMQDPESEGDPATKVVYIGDMNQLPPVGDMQTITPHGDYQQVLTKIHRTGEPGLLDVLSKLVSYIEGTATPQALVSNDSFIRGSNIVEQYKLLKGFDATILAYTNQRVEELNAEIAGDEDVTKVFSPTMHKYLYVASHVRVDDLKEINLAYGNRTLSWNSQYKTLEHLITMDNISFSDFTDEGDEDVLTYAYIFGHYQYKLRLEEYQRAAVEANNAIEQVHNTKASYWAQANKETTLARKRAKAWRNYLTFKECVICIDHPYATTVHKSQGSTFDAVLIDTNNLYICADRDFKLYLRLLYVAISRASRVVYTN